MAVAAVDLAELGRSLLELDDGQRAVYLRSLDTEDLDLMEQALTAAEEAGADWRDNPASLAHHLTRGAYRLYPYIVLMSGRIRNAYDGIDPHQQIWIPSQMGKTTLLGNWTPVWALDRDPTLRIMYISYDANKAVQEAGKARDIARDYASELRFELRPDQRARGMWSTPQGGGLYAVGVDGGIVGWPADAVHLDDLIKGWKDAHSPAVRESTWSIWRSQIRMRVQGGHCPIIAANTRWHEDDINARMLKLAREEPDADQWTVTRLAAIAEAPDLTSDDPIYREPDPLGRQPGEVIEPARFNEAEVRTRAVTAGPYLAAAIEQQKPTPEEGSEILREWWKYADTAPPQFDLAISSWDTKYKDTESGDYVVGQFWGRVGGRAFFVDQMRGQWNQTTMECAVCLMEVRHPQIQAHYIEATGKGPEIMTALRAAHPDYVLDDKIADGLGMTLDERALVQAMRRRGIGRLHPVYPKGPKEVRMRAVSGYISGGDVTLVDGAWNATFVNECAAFPNGQHDDQVDACSQALAKLMFGQSSVSRPQGTIPKAPIDTRAGGGTMTVAPTDPRMPRPGGQRPSRVLIPRGVPGSGR